VLYLAASFLALAGGHAMRIPWSAYQLLDKTLLSETPFQSLLLLHGQPPLLNLLLSSLLAASSTLGISPETLGYVFFLAAGAALVVSIWELTRLVTGSLSLAWTGAAILLIDPGFRHFQHSFFYTFLSAVLLALLLLCSARYLERGRTRDLAAATACLVALPLLRTLFPALWALLFLALLLALRSWRAGDVRLPTALAVAATLAVLLSLWPLKNQVVFGEFIYSSWSGYNLARRTPDGGRELQQFLTRRQIPPGTFDRIARIEERFGDDAILAIAAPIRSDGGVNWNHALFLETRASMQSAGVEWRLRNPVAFGGLALEHYWMWSRATWAHPYFGAWFAPGLSGIDHGIDRILTATFFADLRPAIEGLLPPGELDGFALLRERKVPFTLFGLLLFPGTVIAAATLLLRRRPRWSTAESVVALSLFCILWTLALPCLVDGIEGNRMRYTTGGLLTVVGLYVVSQLGPRLFARFLGAQEGEQEGAQEGGQDAQGAT